MRAHQCELSTEALDFYGRVALSLLEQRLVIVSTEEVHFYGTDTRFYKKDQLCFFLRKKDSTVHGTIADL